MSMCKCMHCHKYISIWHTPVCCFSVEKDSDGREEGDARRGHDTHSMHHMYINTGVWDVVSHRVMFCCYGLAVILSASASAAVLVSCVSMSPSISALLSAAVRLPSTFTPTHIRILIINLTWLCTCLALIIATCVMFLFRMAPVEDVKQGRATWNMHVRTCPMTCTRHMREHAPVDVICDVMYCDVM